MNINTITFAPLLLFGLAGAACAQGNARLALGDIWLERSGRGSPAARSSHTAVWTGSEMIVWGGDGTNGPLNEGGRYKPATDSWTAMATSGAPTARFGHTAVWTGSEMIVWGGGDGRGAVFNDGGRYDPATDTWRALATNGAPSARWLHTAAWTGSEMIVWGGGGQAGYLNDGGRYNPGSDTWTPVTTSGAPVARWNHTAVWTGSEMIVWGGDQGGTQIPGWTYTGAVNDGSRYNPAADSWTAVATQGAPAARFRHTALWTGGGMIVWGGENGYAWPNTCFNDGGIYTPAANGWTALPVAGAPIARAAHTAVWTGSDMIVWGGSGLSGLLNDGGRYRPTGSAWTAVATNWAPSARSGHTALWTGDEMIVWGGSGADSAAFSDTWSYYPYAPPLRISRSGPNQAVVAWPLWSSPLLLWQGPDLGTNHCTLVTNVVTQTGSGNQVTIAPVAGNRFFHLQYP
jgi:N-acetylneuraminic acid mutarotase